MKNFNPRNERVKRQYFRFLKEADQKSEDTIRSIELAILRFEKYTEFMDFARFNSDHAVSFKKHLANSKSSTTNDPISKATVLATVSKLKRFFGWLACQPGFKSKISVTDIEYFNMSEKDVRAAKSPRFKGFPTIEQIRSVVITMPCSNEVERRDQALIAFTILTGMRDAAIASLRLKHIDLSRDLVKQDPTEVKTKFSKRIDTYFFPVGQDIKQVFVGWLDFLKNEKLFGFDDPLFPKTAILQDKNMSFIAGGVKPEFWSNASPIRTIFRKAFEAAELPYFSPHTFRNTLVNLAEQCCITPEEFKAWSQNLGHEHVLTTFTSYGRIDPHRQGVLVRAMHEDQDNEQLKLDKILMLLEGRADGGLN